MFRIPQALTEKGFSSPQAAVPLGRAVRRWWAFARVTRSIAVSFLVRENSPVGHVHLTNRRMVFGGSVVNRSHG
jgi:hypothetical protein